MLRPLKKDRKNCYSTLDIETGFGGDILDIAIYDGLISPIFFSCWAALIQFIEVHIEEKIYHKFIAHYGGSFDYVSLVEYLTNQTEIKYDIIMSQSKIVVLYVYLGDKRIEFIDSSNVFTNTSLEDLCKLFKIVHGKLEGINRSKIAELKKNDPEIYYKYLGLDVISLFEICKSFEKYLEIDFFPLTLASLSMYLYRRHFQRYILFKPRPVVDEFISKAYAGGRVECFRPGQHELINTFDINSLYPSVMRNTKFPIGTPVRALTFHPDKIGVYHVHFNQENKSIPPLLWEKNERNGLEFVYYGEGYFFDPEIRLALENGVKIEIINGYIWIRSVYLFRDFVDHYYNLRMQNEKGTAMNYICKILLNALYGKFGQKENKSVLRRLDHKQMMELISRKENSVRPYDIEKSLFEVTEPRPVSHRIINLAAQVTCLARTKLNSEIIKHSETIVYCDTDSLHLIDKLSSRLISKSKLGKWKREDSGIGIYTGRKQYCIGNKIRFKGIKLTDKLDDGRIILNKLDLSLVNKGLELEKSYSYFPHVKTMLKTGRKACKIYHINKIARRSYYHTNFLGSESNHLTL